MTPGRLSRFFSRRDGEEEPTRVRPVDPAAPPGPPPAGSELPPKASPVDPSEAETLQGNRPGPPPAKPEPPPRPRPATPAPADLASALPEPPTIGRISKTWRRRVADLGWPRPAYAVDGGRIGDFEVLAASVVGQGHLHRAIQRQDAYCLAASGEAAVIAIADGVSQKPQAAIGAEVAAYFAVQSFLVMEKDEEAASGSSSGLAERLADAVDRAEAAVCEAAEDLRLGPRELSTTLLLAHVSRNAHGAVEVVTAAVGNSSALEIRGEELPVAISGPGPDDSPSAYGEFVPGVPGTARIDRAELRPDAALVLATDGFAEDLSASETLRRWLWERLAAAQTPLDFAHVLAYRRQGSMDDLTAVAVRVRAS